MQRQFVTLEENASVASAVKEMQSQKLESVIVTRRGLAVSIATSSDVVEKVVLRGEDSRHISLKSIMSFPPVTISSAGTVKQELPLTRVNTTKRVLVADSTGVIGLVTRRSLADAVNKSVLERALERASRPLAKIVLPSLEFCDHQHSAWTTRLPGTNRSGMACLRPRSLRMWQCCLQS